MFTSRLAALAATIASVIVIGCASAPPPPPEPVGLAGLPPRITVNEWPFWVDIPIETKDFDRTWRTVVDIVSERAAIGVLDKESGYVRTEWRPADLRVTLFDAAYLVEGLTSEQRYTFRIRPAAMLATCVPCPISSYGELRACTRSTQPMILPP